MWLRGGAVENGLLPEEGDRFTGGDTEVRSMMDEVRGARPFEHTPGVIAVLTGPAEAGRPGATANGFPKGKGCPFDGRDCYENLSAVFETC